MKSRLVIMNPRQAKAAPWIPTLLADDGEVLFLYQDGRAWRVETASLETVTREDLRTLLHLRETDTVLFSDVRDLPSEDLMSPEVFSFCREWWREFVEAWQQAQGLAKAS